MRPPIQAVEAPDFRLHQRRVVYARLFAELFNFKLIDSAVVFRVLYMLINHGHALRPGRPAHVLAQVRHSLPLIVRMHRILVMLFCCLPLCAVVVFLRPAV